MKVVLDANVLISFLLTSGPTISKILKGWKDGKFTLLVSDEILTEIKQIFMRFVVGKLVEVEAAEALIRRIMKDAKVISVISVVTASPDKKDNRYLTCAKDGKAEYLVTGDKKHLLPLKRFGEAKIISPREFVKILER